MDKFKKLSLSLGNSKWIEEPTLTIISVLISTIVMPIVLILLIPVYIIRYLVQVLSRTLKPDLREMLSGYSTIFSTTDVYTKPTCSGVFTLMVDNDLDMAEIEKIASLILSKEKYAKAKQLLVTWMGFTFWKNNPDFSLKNHLIVHKETIRGNAELERLKDELLKKPWSRVKPIWEVHFLPNLELQLSKKIRTVVLIRVHHTLLDWYSMVDFLKEIKKCRSPTDLSAKLENGPTATRVTRKLSKSMLIYMAIKLFIYGPYDFVKSVIFSTTTSLGRCIPKEPTKEYESFETIIPIEHVKHIAKINGVRTAAVTFSALTGALRQLIMDLEVDIPESVPICLPIPLPGPRPVGFCNYFSSVNIHAPVGRQDPFDRLNSIQKQFESLEYSTQPYLYYLFFQLIGGLFNWMTKALFETPVKSTAATIAPGPSDMDDLLGIKTMSFGVAGAMPFGDVVILGFYSFSMNGSVALRVTGDKILFPDSQSSQRFISLLLKEMEILNWDADNGNRPDRFEDNYYPINKNM